VSPDKRRIGIFTGTRADYGLLKYLVSAVSTDPRAELLLIVSGSHLSETHGKTAREITDDGIAIAAQVPLWSGKDSTLSAAHDFGSGVGAFADCLNDLRPDIVVVLGDRLEALAMATAATILGIPVAHIHGGEITEGAMDDSLRHAITKLSYLHFTSTEEHRKRVIQLGEEPGRVFNFGAPVLDAISALELMDPAEIESRFAVTVGPRTVLMTFHPAAFETPPSISLLKELLKAFGQLEPFDLIITGTNSDIGSVEIRDEISRYVTGHPRTTRYVESFGQLGYLSVMKQVGLVVGNSSSTVLEAPLLGTPSVLIGDRQAGRPLSASVLKAGPTASDILAAMKRGLTEEFRQSLKHTETVFGSSGFSRKALEELLRHDLPTPPRKRFWDMQPGNFQQQ
jgi:UDP-hydrolysing UDP-N-acetyl-D-glucosamine 2-epimerase